MRAPDRSYLQSHHSDRPCLDSDINRLNKYAQLNKSLLFENTLLNQTGTNGSLIDPPIQTPFRPHGITLYYHRKQRKEATSIHSAKKEKNKEDVLQVLQGQPRAQCIQFLSMIGSCISSRICGCFFPALGLVNALLGHLIQNHHLNSD